MTATGPAERKRPAHLWKPGQSGNLAGRPKGSRNKLSTDFLDALSKDFEEHGAAAIAEVRTTKPEHYLKAICSVLPRNLELDVSVGPSPELRTALAEFAADYTAVRDAMARIGANPVLLEATDIDDDE